MGILSLGPQRLPAAGANAAHPLPPMLQAVEVKVDHRGGEQGQYLAHHQPADDGDAQRAAQLASGAGAERQRQGSQHGGECGHQNGAETQQAGFENGVTGTLAFNAFGGQSEIDDQDAVLLHQADQQNDADHGDDAEVGVSQHQSQQGANARRGEGGENGDGVYVALV